jgi:CheY-like chemotaxis protein
MTDILDRYKLLVIDDSEIVLAAEEAALSEVGFEVRAVSSLRSFVNALLDWKPHVVVTDLYMPEMSGAELCTWIRRQVPTARIPIVVCSGAPEAELEVIARGVGANAYVSKQAGLPELQRRLRELCNNIIW